MGRISRAQVYFVAALCLALMVAVFAVQNPEPVGINFLVWHIEGISKVLVIFLSTAAGALAVLFLGAWWQLRRYFYVRRLEAEVQKLRAELAAARGKEVDGAPGS